MFSARLHRLASARLGVEDYRRLVESKLHTAGELYEFMMDQFHEGRAFIMELVIIVILIIDLVFIFRGKG
jgi:predicted house-cleaning noncanonical NTP pyrophosphatase (MazG superfamily)